MINLLKHKYTTQTTTQDLIYDTPPLTEREGAAFCPMMFAEKNYQYIRCQVQLIKKKKREMPGAINN
jgi:hypothetical protein